MDRGKYIKRRRRRKKNFELTGSDAFSVAGNAILFRPESRRYAPYQHSQSAGSQSVSFHENGEIKGNMTTTANTKAQNKKKKEEEAEESSSSDRMPRGQAGRQSPWSQGEAKERY